MTAETGTALTYSQVVTLNKTGVKDDGILGVKQRLLQPRSLSLPRTFD